MHRHGLGHQHLKIDGGRKQLFHMQKSTMKIFLRQGIQNDVDGTDVRIEENYVFNLNDEGI
jgi:hypothetical protein